MMRRDLRGLLGLATAASLLGCPASTLQVGGLDFECAAAADCAAGFVCIDGRCAAAGSVHLDAAPGEVARRDAEPGDLDRDAGAALDRRADATAPDQASPTDRGLADRPPPSDAGNGDAARSDGAPGDRLAGDRASTGGDASAADAPPGDARAGDQGPVDRAPSDAPTSDRLAPDALVHDSGVEDSAPIPPPALDGFSAATGPSPGSVVLDLDFPDDTAGFLVVQVRRAAGAQAPDCSSGDVVASLSAGDFVDVNLLDQGLIELATYSYRVCVYDTGGLLTWSRTATADAMGCFWQGETARYTGLPADIIDAWAGQWPIPNVDPPRQILASVSLVAGSRVVLGAASGNSVCRIYNNQVQCSTPCPGGWKLFFKDAAGALLWSAGMAEDLSSFVDGVLVPAGAATAWIGYRESGCTTGENCSGMGDPYLDNCDNRTVNGSCDRCDFEFRHEVWTCNGP